MARARACQEALHKVQPKLHLKMPLPILYGSRRDYIMAMANSTGLEKPADEILNVGGNEAAHVVAHPEVNGL